MKIHADLEKCQGFANCVMAAPDHFDLNDESLVVVLRPDVEDEDRSDVEEAIRSCPAEAIWLSEAEDR
jgi:ferredoxin